MTLNTTNIQNLCGRFLPLPFSNDPTEAIDQAEAALIVHADEIQRSALILAGVRLLPKTDLAALAIALTDRPVWAGIPLPPLIDLREDAVDWALFATLDELRAFCGACLRALPEDDVAALSAALARRAAA